MREIKFRAWDVDSQSMNIINPKHPDGYLIGALVSRDGWKVMQFTGLKDKNGVDIYEGDIVEYCPRYFTSSGGGFSDKTQVAVVEEIGKTQTLFFNWQASDASPKYSPIFLFSDRPENKILFVIGNRFENPELLKNPERES